MGFQLHTLQLLPGPERSSYAGAVVEVLEGLDGRLRVRHEGRIIAPQEAPPSPVFLRKGHGGSATPLASTSGANHLDQRWAAALKPLDSRAADEEDQAGITGGASAALTPATVPRANQPSCRRRDGRQFRKPCARGCRCGRSRGIWGSTEPPSRNTWMPTVLRGGSPGLFSLRQHPTQWRHNKVTFMLAFDTVCQQLPAHVVHFNSAAYNVIGRPILENLLLLLAEGLSWTDAVWNAFCIQLFLKGRRNASCQASTLQA